MSFLVNLEMLLYSGLSDFCFLSVSSQKSEVMAGLSRARTKTPDESRVSKGYGFSVESYGGNFKGQVARKLLKPSVELDRG